MNREDVISASFLPRYLVRMSIEKDFFPQPHCSPVQGALLLVDISGFTKLSEVLSLHGAWGLELLAKYLNTFFYKIISITEKHSGDVIKIAGDAMLVFFRVNPGYESELVKKMNYGRNQLERLMRYQHASLAKACLSAVKCALECVELSKSFRTTPVGDPAEGLDKGSKRLTVHCAITCGNAYDVICGGLDGSFEYLLVGTLLFTSAAACLKASKSGEVCLESKVVVYVTSFADDIKDIKFERKTTPSSETIYSATRVCSGKRESGIHTSVATVLMQSESSWKAGSGKSTSRNELKNWLLCIGDRTKYREKLSSFLPTIVRSRIHDKDYSMTYELRNCSLLFVGIHDLSFHGDSSLETIQEAFQVIQESCQKYNGYLRQFLMDEKGCMAIIVFGAPGNTQGNDPVRACLCAREIYDGLVKQGLECSVGCSKGKVICGDVGDYSRREYAFIGSVVNMAAHLMSAKKGVLCTPELRNAASYGILFRKLDPVIIKGYDDGFEVYEPTGPAQTSQIAQISDGYDGIEEIHLNSLDGFELLFRGNQERTVSKFADIILKKGTDPVSAEEVESRTLLIHGQKACGKTTIASRVIYAAQKAGIEIMAVSPVSSNLKMMFSSVRSLLDQLLEIDENMTTEEKTLRLMEGIVYFMRAQAINEDEEPANSAGVNESMDGTVYTADFGMEQVEKVVRQYSMLNSILGLAIESDVESQLLHAKDMVSVQKELILKLVLGLLQGRSLLILVKDLDRMDSASQELIYEIAHLQNRQWFCITYASHSEEDPMVQKYIRSRLCTCVEMNPLNREEVRKYTVMCIPTIGTDSPVFDYIFDKTHGIPAHVKDAVSLLQKRVSSPGSMTEESLTHSPAAVLSDFIQGVISGQIDRLNPKALSVVKIASVVGPNFLEKELRQLSEGHSERISITQSLKAAQDLAIITLVSFDPPGYSFQSQLLHDCLYQMLPLSQRRKLHEDYARYLELQQIDDHKPFAETIARHYQESMTFLKAADYYCIAASYKMELKDFESMHALLQKAMVCLERYPGQDKSRQILNLEWQLSIANYKRKNYQKSLESSTRFLSFIGVNPEISRFRCISTLAVRVFVELPYYFGLRQREEDSTGFPDTSTQSNTESSLRPSFHPISIESSTATRQKSSLAFQSPEQKLLYLPTSEDVYLKKCIALLQHSKIVLRRDDKVQSLAFLIKSYEFASARRLKDVELDVLVRLTTMATFSNRENIQSYLFQLLVTCIQDGRCFKRDCFLKGSWDSILYLVEIMILQGKTDYIIRLFEPCFSNAVNSRDVFDMARGLNLVSIAHWISGASLKSIEAARKYPEQLKELVHPQVISNYYMMLGLNYLRYGIGKELDISGELYRLIKRRITTHSYQKASNSLHLALVSFLTGTEFLLIELLEWYSASKVENNIPSLSAMVLIITGILTSITYPTQVPSAHVLNKSLERRGPKLCRLLLNQEPRPASMGRPKDSYLLEKIIAIINLLSPFEQQFEYVYITRNRVLGYYYLTSQETDNALVCFERAATKASQVGITYEVGVNILLMEKHFWQESESFRSRFSDSKAILSKLVGPESYEYIKSRDYPL